MKVSLNWVKQYIDFDLPPIDELVDKISAQLGAVEKVIELGQKYQGIMIVKVVSCEKHPNADKLNICRIDDGGKAQDVERGDDGLVQVVCGASNVTAGVMAVWLPPGSTVPVSFADKTPFILSTRELRGVSSNGMLASSKELAIGDNHEGLLLLEPSTVTLNDVSITSGADFAEVFALNDYIIDIENKMFTHRPDCFGMLGVAREIAGIMGHKFTSPGRYRLLDDVIDGSGLELEIENEIPSQVPRFMAVAIKNVEVKPSPLWLQIELAKLGAKPISNVVDVTNYMMLMTGQPMHAYDYDKLASGRLGARFAKPGEKLSLLNGKTIELNEADMVITDSTKPIGLAGVIGGNQTEVSSGTRNIILECGTFDMYTIRRTSMRHGLFTDAVTRFSKGQSPLQNPYVTQLAVGHLQTLTGGETASKLVDNDSTEARTSLHPPVELLVSFVNMRLGFKLTTEHVKNLLENVEFTVEAHDEELIVRAPFWRTDIEQAEDVVEEIGRLYGYDKAKLKLPTRDITPTAVDPLLGLKFSIRERLAKFGSNEVLTYSFVHGNLLQKADQDPEKAYSLSNALSPDLQYYRLSLTPSLLDKVYLNLRAGFDRFALFEIGKTHSLELGMDDSGVPIEMETVSLVLAGADKLKLARPAYYEARYQLKNLIGSELGFKPIDEEFGGLSMARPYDVQRSAIVSFVSSGEVIGIVGEFKPSVKKAFKLPEFSAGFEIYADSLTKAGSSKYQAVSRFPAVVQDITFKIISGVSYQALHDALMGSLEKHKPVDSIAKIAPLDIYQKQSETKSISFRLSVASYDRTLTDREINLVLNQVAESLKSQLNAERT